VSNINELTEKEADNLIKTVRFVSAKLKKYLRPNGVNYGFNEGLIAGQNFSHFHFHILPRFTDDKVFQYHLFHNDPKFRSDWNSNELSDLVTEFKKIF
jgi:diadenosine tetraphosphate (Ap4A) HIT family hydrolase